MVRQLTLCWLWAARADNIWSQCCVYLLISNSQAHLAKPGLEPLPCCATDVSSRLLYYYESLIRTCRALIFCCWLVSTSCSTNCYDKATVPVLAICRCYLAPTIRPYTGLQIAHPMDVYCSCDSPAISKWPTQ